MCLTRFTRIATAGDRTQNPTFSAAKARIIAIVFLSHGWRIGLIVTSYVEPVPQRRSPSSATAAITKAPVTISCTQLARFSLVQTSARPNATDERIVASPISNTRSRPLESTSDKERFNLIFIVALDG